MNKKHTDQLSPKTTDGATGNRAEPKGQDILKADAEGAGSEASEFAEGGYNGQAVAQSNTNAATDSETVGHP